MSSEASTAAVVIPDAAGQAARRAALRLAFGVTACFAAVQALRWDATFVAPLLAAQMLVKPPRPPSLAQGARLIVLFLLSTGGVLAVTMAFMANPAVLILALALVLYFSFYVHLRGAPEMATLLVQISAVSLPVLAVLSPDTALAFAGTLVSAGAVALLTVWVAHAVFPEPVDVQSPVPLAKIPPEPGTAERQALLHTLVLLPAIVWFLLDASKTVDMAIVMLIVVVTLLRQTDARQGQRAGLGLIVGNAIGGIAAVIAYSLVLINGTFLFFIFACLAMSLLFAGQIATSGNRAPLYVIAYATFILLIGLGMSPLPGGSGEAFASRLINVLLASAYAVGAVSVVERWRRP